MSEKNRTTRAASGSRTSKAGATAAGRTLANPVSKSVPAASKEVVARPKVQPIEARVAELLTERDLVLNRGSEAGVELGMRFKIINPRGTEIRDPQTHEVLGSVELVKVVVKVVAVQPKLSVARTFKTIDTPATGVLGGAFYGLGNIAAAMGSSGGSRFETLRSSERFAQEDLDESQSYVKLNDPAVQVVSTAGVDY